MSEILNLGFKDFTKRLDALSRDAKSPLVGTFELTPRCNLKCKMCYVRLEASEMSKHGRELTAEEWKSLGDQAVAAGTLFLQITGGEPLLRKDFFEIYDYLCDIGLILALNTNATLITPEIAERLAKRPPHLVSVTLYGGSPDTYENLCSSRAGYEKTISGMENLMAVGIRPRVMSTIVRDNVDDIVEVLRFAIDHDLKFIPSTVIFKGREESAGDAESARLELEEKDYLDRKLDAAYELLIPEEWAKSQETLREMRVFPPDDLPKVSQPTRPGFPCAAGNSKYWITWKGEMKPCAVAPFPVTYPLKDGFLEAWQNIVKLCAPIAVPDECVGCKYRKYCLLCLAALASETGEYGKVTAYACEEARRRFKLFGPASEQ